MYTQLYVHVNTKLNATKNANISLKDKNQLKYANIETRKELFQNLSFNHMYRLFDKTKTIACFRKCKCSIELQYIYVI